MIQPWKGPGTVLSAVYIAKLTGVCLGGGQNFHTFLKELGEYLSIGAANTGSSDV